MRLSSIRNWLLLVACLPAHAATEPSMTLACCVLQDRTDRHHGTAEFFYRYSGQAASGDVTPRPSANMGPAGPASIKAGYERGRVDQKHHRFHHHRRHNAKSDRVSDAASDATT